MFSEKQQLDNTSMYQVHAIPESGDPIALQMDTSKYGWVAYDQPVTRKDWAALRDQVIFDFKKALETDKRLQAVHVRELRVYRVYQQHGEREKIALQNELLLTVVPGDQSFHVADL
jgi:hypothetical protein